MRWPWLLVAFLLSVASSVRAEVRCPLKVDPPPAIDGDLKEWYPSEAPIPVTGKDIAFCPEKWHGDDDLSGTLWMYWDENYLYVAGEVIDNMISQDGSGPRIWYGDHLELYLDTKWRPGVTGNYGEGQFHIGLSPGNLAHTGDPLFDIPPEVVFAFPDNLSPDGCKIAAKKTEKGYNIEAAIPWKLLKVKPARGMVLGVDLCISDTDGTGDQDKMSSLVPGKWEFRKREHLVSVKLGDAHGQ